MSVESRPESNAPMGEAAQTVAAPARGAPISIKAPEVSLSLLYPSLKSPGFSMDTAVPKELMKPESMLPLVDRVAPPLRRVGILDNPLGEIVIHEVSHWLVAEATPQVDVVAITFVPNRDATARTILSGFVTGERYNAIAAAGGIYRKDGTGSDQQKIHDNGGSYDSSVQIASNILFRAYSNRKLQKIYEITASLAPNNTLRRADLQAILAHADAEIEIEDHIAENKLDMTIDDLWMGSNWLEKMQKREQELASNPMPYEIPRIGEFTVITETIFGTLTQYFKDGKEVQLCPICGGVGACDPTRHGAGKQTVVFADKTSSANK